MRYGKPTAGGGWGSFVNQLGRVFESAGQGAVDVFEAVFHTTYVTVNRVGQLWGWWEMPHKKDGRRM